MARLTITVLGCSGSYPGPGAACSGYLVRTESTTVWLDAGSGTLANLQRHVSIADVDAVVLSHEHPDHWRDIEGFDVACAYAFDRHDVPVYAPAGMRALAYPFERDRLVWHEVTGGDEVEIGDMTLRFSRTDHGPETLAVRVDADGASVGYSADTGPEWRLAALGEALDVVLCEATFLREQEGLATHLSARQAGEAAREARARRLVLTHLWPGNDPAQSRREGSEAFGGDVEIAREGMEVSV